jgi:glucose-1-phosphate thymidylyltransferase
MILGDNIFHGAGLGHQLQETLPKSGAHIFTYTVSDPTQYGVLNLDEEGRPSAIEEKPKNPTSNLAVSGLYFFDERVPEVAKQVTPSPRGELEITSVIDWYLKRGEITLTKLSRGAAWLDTGNPDSMHEASAYVKVIEDRTGLKIACLEEIAFFEGWVTLDQLKLSAEIYGKSSYGTYLRKLMAVEKPLD